MDVWLRMGLSVIFGVLDEVVKNPKKKAAIKKAMVKLRDELNMLYPPSED